jgi:hypothetical protein
MCSSSWHRSKKRAKAPKRARGRRPVREVADHTADLGRGDAAHGPVAGFQAEDRGAHLRQFLANVRG